MATSHYSMSFTSGTLLFQESMVVASAMVEIGDWDKVRAKVLDRNLLQMRTTNSSKRIYREISSRLRQLSPAELGLLNSGTYHEQTQLLWLAICKRYRYIFDFAVEVLHEKLIRYDLELSYEDYDTFFNSKAEWHPEVDRVTEATRKKQRQVIFKMLREAEFLSTDNYIQPVILSRRLTEVIRHDSPAYFAIFPTTALG